MQLDSTFSVTAPVQTVWDTLMDFERVAGCVPGAQILNRLSDDAYQVGMKVKLGPVTMQYRGQMNVDERDEPAHRAVFSGKAQETRGQGTAQATVTLILTESGGITSGTVSADMALSGKAAAMGKGVISSVTDQMMRLFADNLQELVEEGPGSAPAPVSDTAPQPVVAASSAGPEVILARSDAVSPPVASAPVARPTTQSARSTAPAETSLNAMTLARGMVTDQLSKPCTVVGLLAAVALIAYQIGRRVAGR
ncbi:SRPBCC family protein [Cryobacterium sp. CG_9.6]|uniref:SRPBCC family protein n=1 Tax=Cryobacterium sp. CG_9.6 TaxID=2760710 RepID=UPI0024747A75|nr:SRPBCC family protein [Cryobacterium sp. CG_9.6]MDH6237771.1 carbon monoxide dehydrogenase subunit G [Cryobacterium sp. CG_9.6]